MDGPCKARVRSRVPLKDLVSHQLTRPGPDHWGHPTIIRSHAIIMLCHAAIGRKISRVVVS